MAHFFKKNKLPMPGFETVLEVMVDMNMLNTMQQGS